MSRVQAVTLLRQGDPEVMALLTGALESGASIAEVAEAFGFAGPSTLWRIAAGTPAVRAIIKKHGRKRGRICQSHMKK